MTPATTTVGRPRTHRTGPLLLAVLLVAANLRLGVTSLGALLDQVHDATGMSAATASSLTSLPVLCFAVVGATGMALARRVGVHRGIAVAMALLAAGLGVRVLGASPLLVLGTLLACAGIALANVLLPAVVKEHFPDRVGAVTGAYSAVLSGGAALGAAATAPIADAAGSWRAGLGTWAVVAVAALVAWAPYCRDPDHTGRGQRGPSLWRSPTAWAVTVIFATQGIAAYVVMSWLPTVYVDAGFSHRESGLLLAVSILVGVPVFFVVPTIATRLRSQGHLLAGLSLLMGAGFLGLWLAPVGGAWLWAVILGVGGGIFPVVLTLFSLRAADSAATAALSAMGQSVGYLLAAGGPLGVGLLRDATGSWSLPLALLVGLMLVQIPIGYAAGRPVLVGAPRN
ncbi:MFS transporter [Nocardioides phosphati]|uniref:MFS transporter n=1 Tax=Nocardioides phosphati TaxID=1867775 RepID=A0ABQ2N9R6_9ACTN|nr:MFS transporter [Nocardioides phosphati]GGO88477.1 MFS transporter [Nocardioides phosphati]